MRRKAQFSHGDFIIGFIIFSIAILLFFKYYPHISPSHKDTGEDVLIEGKLITDSFLSEGYPSDWTTGNVVMIGLTEGKAKLNETKIMNFFSMDYQETRNILKTRYDYYFYFTYKNNSILKINGTEGKGYPGVNSSNIDSIDTERLTKITRLAEHNLDIVKMVLLLW